MNIYKKFFIILFFLISFSLLRSQIVEKKIIPKTRILLVFDGSQSMLGEWKTGRKIDIATNLVNHLLDSLRLEKNVEFALRVYGHQSPVVSGNRNCKDTKLEVPFGNSIDKIKNVLSNIKPKGTTPIAYSLLQSADDFPVCKGSCRNVIILITDGIEECGGEPCEVSIALQQKGIVIKPFVIGLGVDDYVKKTLECIGNFYDAKNENSFKKILNVVISQILNKTTAQVNLLDIQGRASESNVAMTFYDNISGRIRYNFVHTINDNGEPDTLMIDPLGVYNLVVHTVPPVKKDSITLIPGKHNIIALSCPQGDLIIKTKGKNEYGNNLICLVKKSGENEILNVQNINEKKRYLVGNYELEILSLPRLKIDDVRIIQNHTTKIEIPTPGLVTFIFPAEGYASLYTKKGTELEWIYNFNLRTFKSSLFLQPGNYTIIFRAKNAKSSLNTIVKNFNIKSGESIAVKIE